MSKTTTEMQLISIDKLVPYVNNARTHSAEQILKLRSSLREFGFVNPIIIDREFNVIAGHGRLMAAKEEGIEEVPCVFVDYLTDAQKKAYILADNRMAMDAGWDDELLKIEMEELQNLGYDLEFTGFDEKELADLFGVDDKEAFGEPTEAALVNYANKIGLPKYKLSAEAPRIGEVPFDSMRKLMTTVHNENGQIMQYTKGACEILLERCSNILKDGKVEPITEADKLEIKKLNKEYADKALRVLGAAYRQHNEIPQKFETDNLERDLTFIGFFGMIDPCRPEVSAAIANCKSAGIRVVMITGDHIDTATAIGKDLEIIKENDEAMQGTDLDQYSDEEMIDVVNKHSVFARVQPEHKTRIVQALKAQDLVVAMTGDGVNDAPSIKAADIGVAMGITGTDVTKGASDMVLADDNFATIVNAVEEGRKIYDNIRKVLQFQLSTNMAEVLYVFLASAFGITVVTPAQLLWINMVTDSTPGLALGMEKAEGNLMQRKPRASNESVFANGATSAMIVHGTIMAILVLLSFFVGQYMELGHFGIFESVDGMTMAFLTANFIEMFYAVAMRSQRNSIFTMKTGNKWLIGSTIITILLTLLVIYTPLAKVFGLASISFTELLVALGIALSIIPFAEIHKALYRAITKNK